MSRGVSISRLTIARSYSGIERKAEGRSERATEWARASCSSFLPVSPSLRFSAPFRGMPSLTALVRWGSRGPLMPIEFHCPGCGKRMRTPDTTAGRKGRCPHCGTKVQIPNVSLTVTSSPGVSPRASQGPAGVRPPAPAAIHFSCSSCAKKLSVPVASAGKKGKCPHCGALMRIPAPKTG